MAASFAALRAYNIHTRSQSVLGVCVYCAEENGRNANVSENYEKVSLIR